MGQTRRCYLRRTFHPKTFISLGGAETFVEEVHELAGKMEGNGVDVAVDVQVGVTWEGSSSWLTSSLFTSPPGGCRARLFRVPRGVPEPEGARGIEERCRRLGRISTGRVEYCSYIVRPFSWLIDFIYYPKSRRAVAAASFLLASHHVQLRLLQPEQRSQRPVLPTPRYLLPRLPHNPRLRNIPL